MQNTQHIANLLKKSILGTLSPTEEAELRTWAGSDGAYEALLARVSDGHSIEELLLLRHELERDDSRDYTERLQKTLGGRIAVSRQGTISYGIRKWVPYVAAVFIGIAVVTWLFVGDEEIQQEEIVHMETEDIQPGGNRATLTLSNGQTLALDEIQSGIIVDNGNITYSDGSSLHAISGANEVQQQHPMLELATPRGGTYQVTLPDGSKAWLNAASTLRYPPTFNRDERVVEVVGEVYFEVVNDQKRPFRVLSKGQIVEVLGTEFNMATYPDESETKTTLVKGGVQIVHRPSSIIHRLQPGEQAVLRDGSITKINVDVAAVTAWKSGKFSFDGKPFAHVMNEVSRWYDLQVVYDGAIPAGQLVGDAHRSQNLSIVLGMLDVLEIDYELDAPERKLTIYNTKGGNP